MSANLCLIAWNDPIGTPNCSRCFAYSSVVSKMRLRGADHLEREAHRRLLERPAELWRRGPVRVSEHAVAADSNAVEVDVREPPAPVEGLHDRGARRGDGDDDRPYSVVALVAGEARHDDELVDGVALDDEALGAAEQGVGAVERQRRLDVARVERSDRFGDRQRARQLSRRDRAEELLLLVRRARFADGRDELRDGREQRAGRDDPAELLRQDGQLEHAEPDATEALGDRERRPPEVDHRRPEGRRPLVAFDDGPGERDRALVAEHGSDRVAQLFLIGRELEFHCWAFPDGRVRLRGRSRRRPTHAGRSSRPR